MEENLSIHQINSSSIYQYVWSWTINNDFSLEFGYLIDPLTSIMSILITTVGITGFITTLATLAAMRNRQRKIKIKNKQRN